MILLLLLIKTALERKKYSAFGFTEPLMAIEHFNTNSINYGLVISDLRMPAMNGFDFIEGVRQSEVKVLLMTAFAVEDDSDFTMRFKSHNIDGFLHKLFSIRQLNKMVKNHM